MTKDLLYCFRCDVLYVAAICFSILMCHSEQDQKLAKKAAKATFPSDPDRVAGTLGLRHVRAVADDSSGKAYNRKFSWQHIVTKMHH